MSFDQVKREAWHFERPTEDEGEAVSSRRRQKEAGS